MFKIGQHVIHPGQGVCTVVDVTNDQPTPMIVLRAKSGHAATQLMYPQSLMDSLNVTISREDAEDLMSNYETVAGDEFAERNSSLEEAYFKKRIKLGAPETVRVAKTMRTRIAHAERCGKKPSSYYSRVLKEAHRRSVEELAVALEIAEEDVEARMVEAIASIEGQAAFN